MIWPQRPVTRDELIAWGHAIGTSGTVPLVIALEGELGAGKTTLTQAICAGLGVTEDVTSPTFALVHEYRGSMGAVYHLDLYRLRDERDLDNIAWDEIVSSGGAVIIEWPDRAGTRLPENAVRIELRHVDGDPDVRRVGKAT